MTHQNGISIDIVGQIFLMLGKAIQAQEKSSMIEGLSQGLKKIPGVGQISYHGPETPLDQYTADASKTIYTFPVTFQGQRHGLFRFDVLGPARFASYIPYVQNLCNMLGVILEEQRLRFKAEPTHFELKKSTDEKSELTVENNELMEWSDQVQQNRVKEYSRFIENKPVGMFRTRFAGSGQILIANPAAARLFGYPSVDAFLHTQIIQVYKTPEQRKQLLERLLKAETLIGQETQCRKQDGTPITVRMSLQLVRDKHGAPVEVDVTIEDITERKRMEQSLRDSEERFRTLHNASFGGIVIHENGIILDCNQGLSDISGYTFDELIGSNGLRLIAPECLEEVTRKMMSDAEEPYEVVGIRKDGTKYPLYLQSKLIPYKGRTVRVGEFRDITKMKTAENALRESELKYKRLSENSPAIVYQFRMTPDGEFAFPYISDAVESIMGVAAQDVLQNPSKLLGMIHLDDQQNFMDGVLKSAKSLELYHAVVRYLKDGKERWVEARSTPELQEDGSVIWDGFMVDITEKKKSENKLSLLNEAIENSLNGFYIADGQGKFIYANKALVKMHAFESADELIGLSPADLCTDPTLSEKVINVLKDKGEWEFEHVAKRKNGSTFDMLVYTRRSLDEHGNEIYPTTCIDISERKKTERSLIESKARFKALHNASFGGITIHDKGVILECNEGLSKITGYSQTELIGMNGLLLISEKSRKTVMDNILSGYQKPYEAIGLHKSGKEYPIRLEARNIPYKGIDARVVEFRDITDSKKAEAERKELQLRLIQAQKMEAIGTLAGGIAHDFNNILSVVLGYSEMLKENFSSDAPGAEELDQIIKAGNRAKDLVHQILAFSRQDKEELIPIQPHLIIKEALKMLRSSIPSTIKIHHNILNCGSIIGDPTQLHQIVMNLCTNAYHAMRETGGVLGVSLEPVTLEENDMKTLSSALSPGLYLKMEISDTGHGIDKATQQKIFDPYFTTKKKGDGTGLGLAVVHGIAKTFRGHISLYSEPGEGTTFSIYLPQVELDAESQPGLSAESLPTGNEHLLIVDDEEAIVQMEKQMLESLGYKVSICTSSPQALKIFQNHSEKFDVVITDMTMPDMTGVELVQQIRAVKPNISIILCSGFSELVNKEKAERMGIRKYLMKPVLKKDFAMAVREILDEKAIKDR